MREFTVSHWLSCLYRSSNLYASSLFGSSLFLGQPTGFYLGSSCFPFLSGLLSASVVRDLGLPPLLPSRFSCLFYFVSDFGFIIRSISFSSLPLSWENCIYRLPCVLPSPLLRQLYHSASFPSQTHSPSFFSWPTVFTAGLPPLTILMA